MQAAAATIHEALDDLNNRLSTTESTHLAISKRLRLSGKAIRHFHENLIVSQGSAEHTIAELRDALSYREKEVQEWKEKEGEGRRMIDDLKSTETKLKVELQEAQACIFFTLTLSKSCP